MSNDIVLQIAALIAGGPHGVRAPAWLIANMPTLIDMVRASRSFRRRNFSGIREMLNTVERTAINLSTAPNNPDVMSHLAQAYPSVTAASWVEILEAAPEIVKQASLALELGTGDQRRYSYSDRLPILQNRMLCAAIVSEAWQTVREQQEVPLSDDACYAADLLWRASGRASHRKESIIRDWRPQFAMLAAIARDHSGEFDNIRSIVRRMTPNMFAIECSG